MKLTPFLFSRRKATTPMTTNAILHITETDWKRLRAHLLQPDGLERAGFAQLGRSEHAGCIGYFLHHLDSIADEECAQQHATVVEPEPLAVLDAFAKYAKSAAAALMHLHSHPFTDRASFSGVDDANLPKTARDLAGYLRTVGSHQPSRFVRLVVGRSEDGFTAEVMDGNGRIVEVIKEIRIVGASGLRTIRRWTEKRAVIELASDERERLDRNLNWLGEAGQHRIAQTHVAIVGLGGLGSELLKACRGLGFRRYTLVDHDRVEASNLNRLPWSRADVGRLKVEVARDFILGAIPDASVELVPMQVGSERAADALAKSDVLVACLDNDFARLQVQDVAARHLRPLLDMGSGITLRPGSREVDGMGGQVSFHIPGGPCLACQGLDPSQVIDPEHAEVRRSVGYVQGTDETPASVVTINSVVAALGADTLMKWLTGFSTPPTWLRYDLLTHCAIPMKFAARRDCPICGDGGVMGLGESCNAPMPALTSPADFFRKKPVIAPSHCPEPVN